MLEDEVSVLDAAVAPLPEASVEVSGVVAVVLVSPDRSVLAEPSEVDVEPPAQPDIATSIDTAVAASAPF